MIPAPLLEARGITAVAGGRTLFADLDIRLRSGELIMISGPNGAGKSTLLRILLGLKRPDAGTVRVHDGATVGFVPQLDPGDPGLPFPAESVVLQGWRKRALGIAAIRNARQAAHGALERAGFDSSPVRRYTVLSGGERRRVLIARALVGAPQILALDEPTAGVDEAGERLIADLVLDEVRRRDAGAIWIGHGLQSLEEMADHVVRLGGDR